MLHYKLEGGRVLARSSPRTLFGSTYSSSPSTTFPRLPQRFGGTATLGDTAFCFPDRDLGQELRDSIEQLRGLWQVGGGGESASYAASLRGCARWGSGSAMNALTRSSADCRGAQGKLQGRCQHDRAQKPHQRGSTKQPRALLPQKQSKSRTSPSRKGDGPHSAKKALQWKGGHRRKSSSRRAKVCTYSLMPTPTWTNGSTQK